MLSEDDFKANKAADFQPPTGNPQSVGGNLQPGTSGLQPTSSDSATGQQRLPSVSDLKVVVVQDSRSTTNAYLSPVQAARQTWVGPFWGCVALLLIGFIIWVVRQLAKEQVPELSAVIEEAIKEPLITTPAPAPVKKKSSPKKKPQKKKKSRRK